MEIQLWAIISQKTFTLIHQEKDIKRRRQLSPEDSQSDDGRELFEQVKAGEIKLFQSLHLSRKQ